MRDHLREPVRDTRELQQLAGVPVLASFPHLGADDDLPTVATQYDFEPALIDQTRKTRRMVAGFGSAAIILLIGFIGYVIWR